MEGVLPTDWKISTIVYYYKGKRGTSGRRNNTGLKLKDQILKIVERIIEKLIWQQVDIEFGFMPGCGTTDFCYKTVTGKKKNLTKKKEFVPCNCRFGESFWVSVSDNVQESPKSC